MEIRLAIHRFSATNIFLNDYNIPNQTLSYNYIAETTSTVYLTGQGDRGYFDLRGFYFEGLSSHDFQPQQPIAASGPGLQQDLRRRSGQIERNRRSSRDSTST